MYDKSLSPLASDLVAAKHRFRDYLDGLKDQTGQYKGISDSQQRVLDAYQAEIDDLCNEYRARGGDPLSVSTETVSNNVNYSLVPENAYRRGGDSIKAFALPARRRYRSLKSFKPVEGELPAVE